MMAGLGRAAMALASGLSCSRPGSAAAHPRRFLLLLPAAPQAPSGRFGLLTPAGFPPRRLALPGSLLPPPPRLPLPPAARPFSGWLRRNRGVVLVSVPKPWMWLRTHFYFFLIRAYFDREFSIQEFMQGGTQAFVLVSKLISECKYEMLEELVSKEMLQVLREKLALLSEVQRSALAADMDDILFTTKGVVGIHYDHSGRKFVNIRMCFMYLTSAELPDETPDGSKVFQVVSVDKTTKETKRLLTADYEFQREFTQGVKPDWVITRIQHLKLLE